MTHVRSGKSAQADRQTAANARKEARAGLSPQQQIERLKRRPGRSTKESGRLAT